MVSLLVVERLNSLPILYQSLLLGFFFFLYILFRSLYRRHIAWVDVPTVGESGLLSSYVSAMRYVLNSRDVVREGYRKHRGGLFKTADFYGFPVFACGPEIIDELLKLPDDVLSSEDAIKENLQADYLFRSTLFTNPYQTPIVQHNLTRNLATVFPELVDEISNAFDDLVPSSSSDDEPWIPIKAQQTFMQIICRLSNRVFVGLPLCRNKDWIDVNVKYTIDIVLVGLVIRHFPWFLKALVAKFLMLFSINKRYKSAYGHLKPIIQERRKAVEENDGNWECLPNDFLTWLMQSATGEEKSTEFLCHRVLLVNFGAIHTSSTCFVWVLYFLASYPEHIPQLREEIESIIEQEGWTKLAMTRCWKLDSFVKETMRFKPMGSVGVTRIARKDIHLSSGAVIKPGTTVYAALEAVQRDPLIYGPDSHKFNGFRFSDVRNGGDEKERTKHQLVFSTSGFLPFGGGRHACPGRFFAANEIKLITAYIITHFDIQYAPQHNMKHGELPPETWLGPACIPNQATEVLFRRRKMKE